MNYNETLEYIHSVVWRGSRPGLSRTAELLEKTGSPEKGMKFIHVAGTNGQGSTCAMLDSVLRAAGYKTGLYTSPYIVRFNERMKIDGEDISDEELAEIATFVRPFADQMADPPTEFELITAIAFLYFKNHGCDAVVLEVGMGGRLDSTNVIKDPVVSVITGIALDHTAVLGDTIEKIAYEKAGIIKKSRPVVYGGRDDTAFNVIKERADSLGCELTRTDVPGINIVSQNTGGTVFDYRGLSALKIGLTGTYQPENAATVVDTLAVLKKEGFAISDNALRAGLANASWPARFEMLSSSSPLAFFDGSHNVQGVTAAADSIKALLGGKAVILMGVLADKDYRDMVSLIAPLAERVFTVTPPSPRALSAEELASVFRGHGVEAGPGEIPVSVANAKRYAAQKGLPLVMLGSLYMYGEVKKAFDDPEDL